MVNTSKPPILLSLSAALLLQLMVVVSGNISHKIKNPTSELLANKVNQSGNWRLLSKLIEFLNEAADAGGVDFAGLWNENHILVHVTGSLVVLAVGDLPREVWNQQSRVAGPANGVVDDLAWRECLVTALVRENPDPGAEETLHDGVDAPEDGADWRAWDHLRGNVFVEGPECCGEAGKVAGDVSEGAKGVALEAVLWDGADDVAHGVVWDLELVAVRVDELLWLAAHEILGGTHRGEGGGRWGLVRGVHWGRGGCGHSGGCCSATEGLLLWDGGGCHCVWFVRD